MPAPSAAPMFPMDTIRPYQRQEQHKADENSPYTSLKDYSRIWWNIVHIAINFIGPTTLASIVVVFSVHTTARAVATLSVQCVILES